MNEDELVWNTPDPVKVEALQQAVIFCEGTGDENRCVQVASKFEYYLRTVTTRIMSTHAVNTSA